MYAHCKQSLSFLPCSLHVHVYMYITCSFFLRRSLSSNLSCSSSRSCVSERDFVSACLALASAASLSWALRSARDCCSASWVSYFLSSFLKLAIWLRIDSRFTIMSSSCVCVMYVCMHAYFLPYTQAFIMFFNVTCTRTLGDFIYIHVWIHYCPSLYPHPFSPFHLQYAFTIILQRSCITIRHYISYMYIPLISCILPMVCLV